MSIRKRDKILVETLCDLCGESQGTSLIDPNEYEGWLQQTIALLTFDVDGELKTLCGGCLKKRGLLKEFDRRLNDLTYPKEKA